VQRRDYSPSVFFIDDGFEDRYGLGRRDWDPDWSASDDWTPNEVDNWAWQMDHDELLRGGIGDWSSDNPDDRDLDEYDDDVDPEDFDPGHFEPF